MPDATNTIRKSKQQQESKFTGGVRHLASVPDEVIAYLSCITSSAAKPFRVREKQRERCSLGGIRLGRIVFLARDTFLLNAYGLPQVVS